MSRGHGGGNVNRVVVLLSGGGSNLAALMAASEDRSYDVQIVAGGADRTGNGGLAMAAEEGVPTFTERLKDHPTRAEWDTALTTRVAEHRPDLVVSAGFLNLVGPTFLEAFGDRYVNTHNSLLPAFPGMNAPAEALSYGVRITGATLFFVDGGVDTGPVIAQVAVPVEPGDTVDTLTERIKVAERRQLVEYVGRLSRKSTRLNSS